MSQSTPVVIDGGSGSFKSGFAGEDAPRSVIPTLIGRIRKGLRPSMAGVGHKEIFVGDEAQSVRGLLTLTRPVQNGIVQNFDDWEKFFHFVMYNELRVAPEEHPVLMTEACLNPTANREKICQLLFETFNVPATYFAPSPVLSLYSSGVTVGTVLDIGDGVCQVVPIYEGRVIPSAIQRVNSLGGHALNEYLSKLLKERGVCFNTTAEMEQLRWMKEKLCYVAKDLDQEMQTSATSSSLERTYIGTDDQSICVGNELFRCPEALFRPAMLGMESLGVHELVYQSVMKTDIDLRKDFYSTIIPTGGSTMFNGFPERLQSEVKRLVPSSTRVRVFPHSQRKYGAWMGGSILASLSSFSDLWVTRQMYDEEGPSCANRLI